MCLGTNTPCQYIEGGARDWTCEGDQTTAFAAGLLPFPWRLKNSQARREPGLVFDALQGEAGSAGP